MKLIPEEGVPGRHCYLLPDCDVLVHEIGIGRERKLDLPKLSENEISRYYTGPAGGARDINDSFYPLGSYTMEYNPKVDEGTVFLEGFVGIHPLQPGHTVQDALKVFGLAGKYLYKIAGMEAMAFQPTAGIHGESTGLLLVKAYHHFRGGKRRMKTTVPDSAHGISPANVTIAGYSVVNTPSREDGCMDLDKLEEAVGKGTADLILINPSTVGLFDKDILEIAHIIHEAGGLCYYDGANLNVVMGIVRPGDIRFDVVHLNLHKTFSTPRDGGGPGGGPMGCKRFLRPLLPRFMIKAPGKGKGCGALSFMKKPESTGRVKMFYGNFEVMVRVPSYIVVLGREGIPEAPSDTAPNANYVMNKLSNLHKMTYNETCIHELVMILEDLKHDINVSAMDVAKAPLDYGIRPPTVYSPLIVHEALIMEPTRVESKGMLDQTIKVFRNIHGTAKAGPKSLHRAPIKTAVRRLNKVVAARRPILHYMGE